MFSNALGIAILLEAKYCNTREAIFLCLTVWHSVINIELQRVSPMGCSRVLRTSLIFSAEKDLICSAYSRWQSVSQKSAMMPFLAINLKLGSIYRCNQVKCMASTLPVEINYCKKYCNTVAILLCQKLLQLVLQYFFLTNNCYFYCNTFYQYNCWQVTTLWYRIHVDGDRRYDTTVSSIPPSRQCW